MSDILTAARVDILTATNVTWQDAFQFDPTGTTGCCSPPPYWPCGATGPAWNFVGQNFLVTIKGNRQQPVPLMQIDSGMTGQNLIVIDDVNSRILHTNVPDTVLTGNVTGTTGATGVGLVPGTYVYDFVMYDGSTPPVRVMLMEGKFVLKEGV